MINTPNPTPPSGIVTFLFTDIEGSTALWERMPEAMKHALALHDQLLRLAISKHNGFIFKQIGDAFQAAFVLPQDALAASLAAQRALRDAAWGETGALRVRIGIHTGPEEWLGADYAVSHTLNRAARIMSAGHGGEILVSGGTVEHLNDALPPEANLTDLGKHRLKGLKIPEHLFQLTVPDLPAEFPPLNVLESYRAHFETVVRAISENRVVPLLGTTVNLVGRPVDKTWQFGQTEFLPVGSELAEHLARVFDYPPGEPRDLVRVSQYAAVKAGIGPLYDELRKIFKVEYPPTPMHQFFAGLPALMRERGFPPELLIVTTNYDDALERAFRAADEPFDLVTYIAEGDARGKFMHTAPDGKARPIDKPNKYLGLNPEEHTTILKIHGVVDRQNRARDSYVITEDHYIDYLAHKDIAQQLPAQLLERMSWSHFLFLGYSLRDWNLRVILHRIWGEQKFKYKAWAVTDRTFTGEKPQPLEQEFWRLRDVDIVKMPLDDYVESLQTHFEELPQGGEE
ncbi:MAG: SIR2 family protein [Chloroflexi bacterium]|nr:SIR2 family protein [Chloroflexota bacterium]